MEITPMPTQLGTSIVKVEKIRPDEGIALCSCCTGAYAGHVLRSLYRRPAHNDPKAIVIFVHGTFQHSRSVELADLQQRIITQGCVWCGLDAPGHGMSSRLGDPQHKLAPGLVPDIDAYLADLLFYILSVTNDPASASLPVILMGHSWGTALMTILLPQLQDALGGRLRGACYSACTA
mmetsp:Transcript_66142/g.131187  ORF Transcript_66142/g.131187 Transcript_66142/m.131187 type:complete len:178 (-) Transcript_66142:43-576(-)